MNIAVTGGLGTGKSTVSRIFAANLATELIDADQLCRGQMLPGTDGYVEFRRVFADRFFQEDGTIDRRILRQAVFEDDTTRKKLENILHPIVRNEVIARAHASSARNRMLVVEVPLLYETGWQDAFDVCIVVYVPEEICIQRVMTRDSMPVGQIRQIMSAQLPIKKKLDYADFIVDNSGTFVSTVQQIAWMSKSLVWIDKSDGLSEIRH